MRNFQLAVTLLLLSSSAAAAKTLVVTGRLSSEVTVTQRVTFSVDTPPLSELTYRFPLPAATDSPPLRQRLSDHRVAFSPEPASLKEETDRYGNRYKIVTWRNLKEDARATILFTTAIDAVLQPLKADAPFPLERVPEELLLYLKPSRLVQSGDREIAAKASQLASGAATQAEVVDAVLNFVTDHVRYEAAPRSYDALHGFTTGAGNCQNYAHLSCALLRASGIPARVAVGLTLKEKWKIPLDDRGSSLVQGMGDGLHAWIEVWFPEAGWLPFDPQQSKQFTSTRHIKHAHAPDCGETGTTWKGTPVLPRYDSVFSSSFSRDLVDLSLRGTGAAPRRYLATSGIAAATEPAPVTATPPLPLPLPLPAPPPEPAPAPPRPAPVVEPAPAPPKPAASPPVKRAEDVAFGNMRFPETVSLSTVMGDQGKASLEQETAEYVASGCVYAQAFTVTAPLQVKTISLAMRKFGGDGMLYVDLVNDDGGKPGLEGVRSALVPLEGIKRGSGYNWVEFQIPSEAAPLSAGRHWIVLRRSGDAFMNWFYTPGKPYGGPDDTRSTARGWLWEDILTHDFVFKVVGRPLP